MRLNGWQRLWVALFAAWGLFVFERVRSTWPPPSDLDVPGFRSARSPRAVPRSTVDVKWRFDARGDLVPTRVGRTSPERVVSVPTPPHRQPGTPATTARGAGGRPPAVEPVAVPTVPLDQRLDRQEESRTVPRLRRLPFLAVALGLWLFPALSLYAAGAGVAWVRARVGHSSGNLP